MITDLNEFSILTVVPLPASLAEVKRELVKQLVNEDIPEMVAKAGVQAAEGENLDYDTIYLWCLDHEFDENDDVRNFSAEYNRETG